MARSGNYPMCKNVLPEDVITARAGEPLFATSLCLDGGHQRLNAYDVHDAGEIVGEYVQRHLGGDLGQTAPLDVRPYRPVLSRIDAVAWCALALSIGAAKADTIKTFD